MEPPLVVKLTNNETFQMRYWMILYLKGHQKYIQSNFWLSKFTRASQKSLFLQKWKIHIGNNFFPLFRSKAVQKNKNWKKYEYLLLVNPILHGGGPLWPGRPKIVCRFLVDCATLPKFLDFVSFNVLQVSEESFSKKNFFCEKYRTLSKISIGGTLLCKNQKFSKTNFFLEKIIFSAWI